MESDSLTLKSEKNEKKNSLLNSTNKDGNPINVL